MARGRVHRTGAASERGFDRVVDPLAGLERPGECLDPVDLATDGLDARQRDDLEQG